MYQQSMYNSPNTSGQSVAIEKTFVGSTVVRIFDDDRKVARPQMPQSFFAQTSIVGATSLGDISPSYPDRNQFRFHSVRASKVGRPIAITIAPPTTDPTPAGIPSQPSNQGTSAFVNEAYFPFPPTSPKDVYRPTSFRQSDCLPDKSRYLLNQQDNLSNEDSHSSSSSESSDDEGKKIFHYIEFALVSIFVNPLFGIVALVLSISSRVKAKKKKYGEAVWEGRFALMTGLIGIGITILVVVLVVAYVRTNRLCTDC